MDFPCVSARVFAAIQNLNILELGKCPQHEIRPLLPCLVRMSLLSSMDNSKSGLEIRKQILSLLVGIEDVNNIVSLLQVDYHELEIDVKKEQQLRQKINTSNNQDSAQFHSLQNGVALGFERADVTRKVRIVLSELFYIQSQIIEQNQQLNQMMMSGGGGVGGGAGPSGIGGGISGGVGGSGLGGGGGIGGAGLGGGIGAGGSGGIGSSIGGGSNNQMGRNINDNIIKQSELFDNEIYLAEITDIICIALAELPSLFNIQEVIETLLYVNYGATIICWVVANMPDCFKEVIGSLIGNGDEDTPEGRLRAQVLYALCDMNPGQSLPTRTLCVELSKMPSLMLKLSLKDPLDLVAFISGLLLGNDQNTRTWFALFVRTSQKRKGGALQTVREELIKQLQNTEIFTLNSQSDEAVVQAAALLRLYCALRGIAGIKFNDDEVSCIMKLITSRPPPTPAGIRFVSLGLCMLLACPSLIAVPSIESKAVEWIQWLVKEEPYFESNSGVASFGEMLLLMAIHFHSNQTAAICELVCSTLGMKIPLRPNNTSRIKQIFTTDIFTEQVVTAHAVKVPVTLNLNANITGYLPVHCIHQLLKSRAFTKHKVPIKSWIYKQICATTSPLHPVMPALIEVYINSIIAPNAKGSNDHTHKPLSEDEILKVFQTSIVGVHLEVKKKTDIDPTSNNNNNNNNDSSMIQPSVMSQLLLLYYLLLYEDVRLSHAATILANGRKVKAYSTEFLIELPIKFLLQQAQRSQNECSGLFSPLLRLVIAHFPHLSLVDDWLDLEEITSPMIRTSAITINPQHLEESFNEIKQCPLKIIKLMRLMLRKKPIDLWPFAELFTKYIKSILDRDTPRLIQELYRKVWLRLNTVLPRRLWTMTMNALMVHDDPLKFYTYGQESQLMDPLQVLRCDERVFRCPDLLQIVLRILLANMESSKCQLMRLIMDKPLLDKSQHAEQEREDLRNKLVGVQSSAAIHILLDACLETDDDRRVIGNGWALREIRGIICSHLHQWFIAYPACAKLIHFQGYPRELLMVTVRGIPSMHICTDWIPELLNTTEMEKQIFAIDLTSHLSLKYSFPNVLSQAKLCVNALTTLLGHLTNDIRIEMFRSVLPCIVRFAEAFPPLLEECTIFLMQLGRIAESQAALGRQLSLATLSLSPCSRIREQTKQSQLADRLVEEVRATFTQLLNASVLKTKIY